MTELSEIQVLLVERNLQSRGLKYGPLSEELLDHVCTDIEDSIDQGLTFDEAFSKCCVDAFSNKDLKKIQKDTHRLVNRKYIIMRNFTTFTGSVAASFLVDGVGKGSGEGFVLSVDFLLS